MEVKRASRKVQSWINSYNSEHTSNPRRPPRPSPPETTILVAHRLWYIMVKGATGFWFLYRL